MAEEIVAGQVYRHFKHGTRYRILTVAKHSESDERMVVYRDLASGRDFVRPIEMFLGFKEVAGVRVRRFELERGSGEKE